MSWIHRTVKRRRGKGSNEGRSWVATFFLIFWILSKYLYKISWMSNRLYKTRVSQADNIDWIKRFIRIVYNRYQRGCSNILFWFSSTVTRTTIAAAFPRRMAQIFTTHCVVKGNLPTVHTTNGSKKFSCAGIEVPYSVAFGWTPLKIMKLSLNSGRKTLSCFSIIRTQ